MNSIFSLDGLDQISNPIEKYAAAVSAWVYHAVMRERWPEKCRGSRRRGISATSSRTTTFAYNALGQRVAKTVNGSSTYNYYDGFGTLAAIRNSSGWTEEFFPTVGGRNYAKYQNGNTYFLHGDMLASSTMATNQAGSFQQDMLYYPWGGVWSQYSSVDTRFAGMLERDGESQLDPTPNRLFYNYLGRWVTPDPLLNSGRPWDPQTWNMYTYARNNPTTLSDPSGLDPEVTGGRETKADSDATYGAGADARANHADSGKPGPGDEKKDEAGVKAPPTDKPPLQPPPGKGPNGEPNEWVKVPGTSDKQYGPVYRPKYPVPGQAQPKAWWDPHDGWWSHERGNGGRREHYDRWGNRVNMKDNSGYIDKLNKIAPGPVQKLGTAAIITYVIVREAGRIILPETNAIPVP